jgi:hypothetical protein
MTYITPSKRKHQAQVEKAIADFLARGGVITKITLDTPCTSHPIFPSDAWAHRPLVRNKAEEF